MRHRRGRVSTTGLHAINYISVSPARKRKSCDKGRKNRVVRPDLAIWEGGIHHAGSCKIPATRPGKPLGGGLVGETGIEPVTPCL